MQNDSPIKITRFLGVRNTLPPDQLPPREDGAYFQAANNVHVNNASKVERRPGRGPELGFGNVTAAYSTEDESRLFVVDDGDLKEVDTLSPLQTRTLKSSVGSGAMYWTEAGNQIFFAGASTGIIDKTECLPLGIPSPDAPQMLPVAGSLPPGRYVAALVYRDQHGRQGGARTVSEIELTEDGGIQFLFTVESGYTGLLFVSHINGDQLFLLAETTTGNYLWSSGTPTSYPIDQAQMNAYPLPDGIQQLAFADSRLWAAQTVGNTTYIYRSKPFWYHLFDLFDYIAVEGKVEMLLAMGSMVIIGTRTKVFPYSDETGLGEPLPYGVVPGWPGAIIDGKAYFWTTRGYCRGIPFENLTDGIYSVPPGSRAAVGRYESKGNNLLLVATDTSGEANNAYN